MISFEDHIIDYELTRNFANLYKLSLNSQGYIVESAKKNSGAYIATQKHYFLKEEINAIVVYRLNGFANALIQLCNVISLAGALNISTIYIVQGDANKKLLFKKSDFKIGVLNIRFSDSLPKASIALCGIFFWTKIYNAVTKKKV
jgi:hypothetical protein